MSLSRLTESNHKLAQELALLKKALEEHKK
jgi:hypothetical protein